MVLFIFVCFFCFFFVMDGPTIKDLEMAGETGKDNDNGLEYRQRAGNRKDGGMRKSLGERKYLKEATVIVEVDKVNGVKAEDVIKAVSERIGGGKILAVRPRQGKEYEVTMEKEETCEELMDGLTIKGTNCEVKKLQNREYVVSFMHLPVYLDDEQILVKLEGWGVSPISKIKRRLYTGTDIEDGTRYVKVRFPREVMSLPYSTKIETAEGLQYCRVMHSCQVKTCRLCMSPEHLLKDCPDFKCFKCGERGHFARDCNTVKCPDCHEFLIRCECWMEEEEGGGEDQVDGQVHERNNKEGNNEEEQEAEKLQQNETEEESENGEKGEKENDKEQTTEQDTQWTEMEIPDSFKSLPDDVEREGQGMEDQNKETDSEEEEKMDNTGKDRGGRGQIRRRTLKVKPNLENVRKKIMTRDRVKSVNRYEVLRGLEGEDGE